MIMWKLLLVVALPLVPLAAHESVPRGAVLAEAAADVECLIRATPMAGGIELEGVVASTAALSGTYQFDVRKLGQAGTSNSTQRGDFETRSGEEVVGQVGLGLEHGDSYDAKLVLRWKGGEASCSASGSDRA